MALVDTIANRAALAEECLVLGKFEEALFLYDAIIVLPLGEEPQFHLGKARAELGLGRPAAAVATLDDVMRLWPDYHSPEGHLLYAIALERSGSTDEALVNYANVGQYYPGVEPRVRQAQLLQKLGRQVEARSVAQDVVLGLRRAPAPLLCATTSANGSPARRRWSAAERTPMSPGAPADSELQILEDSMRRKSFLALAPIVMFAAGAASSAMAAQATPPVESEVQAPGPSGPLKGTMLAPAAGGAPMVLIIPGSGPTDRNGDNPLGVGADRMFTSARPRRLAAQGVGSVRIDKRGMFGSAAAIADANAVTLDDYASDVEAWIAVMRKQTGAPCVWALGHSEGGLVALVAAQKAAHVCGLVLVAAPGRPLGDILREQLRANPTPMRRSSRRRCRPSMRSRRASASTRPA